ncbi:unnamed protein product [Anisakis simplex]|uniref:Uncharacterized protein n=1 Tax=Anisakis simplex TaxID=6269 RepID=A0A0M3J996_ANISI|nr:unnamed protein product [Anisakis simplex]
MASLNEPFGTETIGSSAFIDIGVVDTEQYERADHFFLELMPPIWAKKMSGKHNISYPMMISSMEQKPFIPTQPSNFPIVILIPIKI